MTMMIWERTGVRSPGIFELSWRRLGLAAALIFDHDCEYGLPWMLHIHFLWMNLFIHFPAPRISFDADKHGEWQTFGFHAERTYIAFNWRHKYRSFDWPWAYEHIAHEVLRPEGTWVPFVGSWEHDKEPDGRKVETFSYAYILRNGDVQKTTATVNVERRFWRQHWLRWTPRFQKMCQGIDVTFADEVGEGSGSWKGGTVGCGYTMRPRETSEKCLRRMEQERKF